MYIYYILVFYKKFLFLYSLGSKSTIFWKSENSPICKSVILMGCI
jgi:hypothetical protein